MAKYYVMGNYTAQAFKGFINNPKFSDPIPIVAAVDIAMTITITQP